MASTDAPVRTVVQEDEEKSSELAGNELAKPSDAREDSFESVGLGSVGAHSGASSSSSVGHYDTVTTQWRIMDFSQLPENMYKLSVNDRLRICDKASKWVQIETSSDGQELVRITGVPIKKYAGTSTAISLASEVLAVMFLAFFQLSYLLPITLTLYGVYLFVCNYCYSFYLYCVVYLVLLFYPHTDWPLWIFNPLNYNLFKYFSFKMAYTPQTQDYMLRYNGKRQVLPLIDEQTGNVAGVDDVQNEEPKVPVITICVPHGIQPQAQQLSMTGNPHITGGIVRAAGATVVLQLPIIRSIFMWMGVTEVSKGVLKSRLALGEILGVVPDGISGMFVRSSENEECVELKSRKGIAKLALETGTHVEPNYAFGNTEIFEPVFDKYGVMKKLSKKLKMSLVGVLGRWMLLPFIPKKVPLYYVCGEVVRNKYAPNKVLNPSQEQIDELHEMILNEIKRIFDIHKHLYGWSHKKLVFV